MRTHTSTLLTRLGKEKKERKSSSCTTLEKKYNVKNKLLPKKSERGRSTSEAESQGQWRQPLLQLGIPTRVACGYYHDGVCESDVNRIVSDSVDLSVTVNLASVTGFRLRPFFSLFSLLCRVWQTTIWFLSSFFFQKASSRSLSDTGTHQNEFEQWTFFSFFFFFF